MYGIESDTRYPIEREGDSKQDTIQRNIQTQQQRLQLALIGITIIFSKFDLKCRRFY